MYSVLHKYYISIFHKIVPDDGDIEYLIEVLEPRPRYFACEFSLQNPYFLCEWVFENGKVKKHINYGEVEKEGLLWGQHLLDRIAGILKSS